MKERENAELTRKLVNPTLKDEGSIFMAEPGGGEIPNNMVDRNEEKPQEAVEPQVLPTAGKRTQSQQIAWDALKGLVEPDKDASLEEKSSYDLVKRELLIRAGIPPIEGGSGEDEPREITDELKDFIVKSREGALTGINNNLKRILKENGFEDSQIEYFEQHPEEFRQNLDAMLSGSDQASESTPTSDSDNKEVKGEQRVPEIPVEPASTSDIENEETKDKDSEDEIKDVPEEPQVISEIPVETRIPNPETEQPQRVEDKGEKKEEYISGDYENFRQFFKDKLPEGTSDEQINEFAKHALESVKHREAMDLPNSFEELVALIMKYQSAEWQRDGEFQLIDKEGKVVKENFVAWVRKRMVDLHEFNPTGSVKFFDDINVKAGYSVISFYDMIFTGSYFMEKKYKPEISDENGKGISISADSALQQNKDYDAMKEQLITEAFLFQNSRNNHVIYLQNMHDERELPKLLNQIYYANPFMRGRFLERVLSMPSMSKEKILELKHQYGLEEILDTDSDEAKAQKEKENKDFEAEKMKNLIKDESEVGEGVRRALLSYYYINDFDMLQEILGEDSIFFKETYLDYDPTTHKPKTENGELIRRKGAANEDPNVREKEKVHYDPQTGELLYDSREQFINYVNVFNDAHKDERIVNEVREKMIQSLVEKLGINYVEAKYAEAWAFSMTRWTGIGARNDVKAIGFDAWSKTQNFMEYRLKQMDPKRAGVVGNIFNLLGIKKTGLSLFEGMTDVHGRTIIEAIQGGQGGKYEHSNPFKKEPKKGDIPQAEKEVEHLEFRQDMSQRFASNHIGNAFRIYDFIINDPEFHLEEMVTYDALGRVIIDQKKANEMMDGIQKQIRYGFVTWGGVDYAKNIRIYEEQAKLDATGREVIKNGKVETEIRGKELPVAAAIFGPAILKFIKEDIERKNIQLNPGQESNIYTVGNGRDSFTFDFAKIQSETSSGSKPERDILWKHVMKYLVATEIKAHRTVESDLKRYSYATTQRIYSFLRSKGILTEEDLKDMRKLSNTSEKRMFAEEFAIEFGTGGAKGIWDTVRFFAGRLFS